MQDLSCAARFILRSPERLVRCSRTVGEGATDEPVPSQRSPRGCHVSSVLASRGIDAHDPAQRCPQARGPRSSARCTGRSQGSVVVGCRGVDALYRIAVGTAQRAEVLRGGRSSHTHQLNAFRVGKSFPTFRIPMRKKECCRSGDTTSTGASCELYRIRMRFRQKPRCTR